MTPRSIGLMGAVGICVATGLLAVQPLAAQAPAETAVSAEAWTVPRTPDGQPDLQGFWTNSNYTPLERPDGVTKEFYTREEALQFEQQFVNYEAGQTVPGTIRDVHYDHTQFGLDRSSSLGGYSSNLRTSLIVDPPNGKLPPLSAEGERRAAERAEARKQMGGPYDAPENLPLGTRCIMMNRVGPPVMTGNYNNNYHIVQNRDYVMFLAEMLHDARVIPLDGRPRLPQNVRQWTGSYRGHWEGDTLVVETANLNGKYSFFGSSENMRVTERFTRLDEDAMRYEFTVDDPSTWTQPWSGEMPMKKITGPLFEHACHEGNYGLYNILAGARAEERRAAEEASNQGSR